MVVAPHTLLDLLHKIAVPIANTSMINVSARVGIEWEKCIALAGAVGRSAQPKLLRAPQTLTSAPVPSVLLPQLVTFNRAYRSPFRLQSLTNPVVPRVTTTPRNHRSRPFRVPSLSACRLTLITMILLMTSSIVITKDPSLVGQASPPPLIILSCRKVLTASRSMPTSLAQKTLTVMAATARKDVLVSQ